MASIAARNVESNRDIVERAAKGHNAPSSWTKEDLVEWEAERVVNNALMALVSAQMPRRGGSEMSARAMSKDKKVSRKIAQTYIDIWRRLNMKQEAPKAREWDELLVQAAKDPDARRAGATVLWPKWVREQEVWLPKRRAKVAAFALREGEIKWGARRVILLDVEERGLQRAKEKL